MSSAEQHYCLVLRPAEAAAARVPRVSRDAAKQSQSGESDARDRPPARQGTISAKRTQPACLRRQDRAPRQFCKTKPIARPSRNRPGAGAVAMRVPRVGRDTAKQSQSGVSDVRDRPPARQGAISAKRSQPAPPPPRRPRATAILQNKANRPAVPQQTRSRSCGNARAAIRRAISQNEANRSADRWGETGSDRSAWFVTPQSFRGNDDLNEFSSKRSRARRRRRLGAGADW